MAKKEPARDRLVPGDFYGDKGAIRPLPYLDGHHYWMLTGPRRCSRYLIGTMPERGRASR